MPDPLDLGFKFCTIDRYRRRHFGLLDMMFGVSEPRLLLCLFASPRVEAYRLAIVEQDLRCRRKNPAAHKLGRSSDPNFVDDCVRRYF